MPIHTLRFTSPEKVFILAGDYAPHAEQIGRWHVSETFTPGTHPDLGAGSYHIVLETPVSSLDEQMVAFEEALGIADEIDVAWCYVFDRPFIAVRNIITLPDAPEHWSGNFWDVQAAILRDAGGPAGRPTGVQNRSWMRTPILPLERLLKVRTSYQATSSVIRELIGLHIASYKTRMARLFMLAKALEVVGKHYGTERVKRNAGLQQELNRMGATPYLKQNVEWLFNIANERFDIRHAVDNKSPHLSLHPKLTFSERQDFEEDATLVVRAFICEQLGVDCQIIQTR